ncbi:MAG: hypothetical protein CRN43_15410, partial [Candidatus Nephrothrix sp. EaCA]
VALFSCKKKEEPAPTVEGLLTGKAWQLTSSSHSNGALQGIEKYQEDDYLVFYPNGTCAFITGEDQTPDSTSTMANPEVKIPKKQTDKASTWVLSDDNKILLTPLLGLGNSQIVITNDKLVLTQARSRGGSSSSYNDSEISIQTLKPKEGGVPVVHTVGLEGHYRYESYGERHSYDFQASFASAEPATEWGFCWGDKKSPAIDGEHLAEDLGTSKLKGLAKFEFKKGAKKIKITRGKSYYLRAYAKNSKGVFYSASSEIWWPN